MAELLDPAKSCHWTSYVLSTFERNNDTFHEVAFSNPKWLFAAILLPLGEEAPWINGFCPPKVFFNKSLGLVEKNIAVGESFLSL